MKGIKMTVKDLIIQLLDVDMNKKVSIEYPTDNGKIVGNYSRYEEAENFKITNCDFGVVLEVY